MTNLHPATEKLVDDFAAALKAKLLAAEQKHGYSDEWKTADWREECQRELIRHVEKGDPIDVAAYAAFCWARGFSTAETAKDRSAQEFWDGIATRSKAMETVAQDYKWGLLTKLGVASYLRRAGFSYDAAHREILAITGGTTASATPKPPAGGDAGEWQRAAYASIAANKEATKLIDRMLASLGHMADGLADQKSSWADYARRLFTESQDTAHADRLAALALPAPVVEGDVAEMDDADIITFAGRFFDPTDNGYGADTRKWIRAVRAALSEGRSHG